MSELCPGKTSRVVCCLAFILLAVEHAETAEVLKGRSLKGSYRLYRGGPQSLKQVAVVANAPKEWRVRLVSIDGVTGPGTNGYGHFFDAGEFNLELPPGPHAVVLAYSETKETSSYTRGGVWRFRETATGRPQVLLFVAKPGMLYRVQPAISGGSWQPAIIESGPLPDTYQRPTASCESFAAGQSRCLDVVTPASSAQPGPRED
jgi:hypothetical protein